MKPRKTILDTLLLGGGGGGAAAAAAGAAGAAGGPLGTHLDWGTRPNCAARTQQVRRCRPKNTGTVVVALTERPGGKSSSM